MLHAPLVVTFKNKSADSLTYAERLLDTLKDVRNVL